jgi:hypothetical protein
MAPDDTLEEMKPSLSLGLIAVVLFCFYRTFRGSGKEYLAVCEHRAQWRFETLFC